MKKQLIIIALLASGLFLRLINLNQSLWLDEAAQAIESIGPLMGLTSIVADFMPPLFHFILHFWMMISHGEVWMRLLPVMFGLATLLYTYKLAKQFYSENTSTLALLLLAISPFHIYYSQELRPYALAAFAGTFATYYLVKKQFVLYTVGAILSLYSFYPLGFLFIAHGIYVFFFEKKYIKQWIMSMGVSFIAFFPWIPTFLKQLSGGSGLVDKLPGWSTAVSIEPLKSLPLTLTKFMLGRITFDNKIIYGAVFVLILLTALYSWWNAWKTYKKTTQQIGLFVIIPTLSIFIFSFLLPIIAPQRLLFVLPYFLIIMASGILSSPKRIQIVLFCLIIIPSFYGLVSYWVNPRFQREQWRQATAFVESNLNAQSDVLFAFPEPFAPYQWYRKDSTKGKGIVKNFLPSGDDLKNLDRLSEGKDSFYYFHYLDELTDPTGKIPQHIVRLGFRENNTYNFVGVGFVTVYTLPN